MCSPTPSAGSPAATTVAGPGVPNVRDNIQGNIGLILVKRRTVVIATIVMRDFGLGLTHSEGQRCGYSIICLHTIPDAYRLCSEEGNYICDLSMPQRRKLFWDFPFALLVCPCLSRIFRYGGSDVVAASPRTP